MTLERRFASMFALDDATWLRHANPWSVWSRNTGLPLLILAFWSRTWIGWWSIVPILVAVAWTWLNPRLFSAPASTDHWSSRAVLGERIWLARKEVPVPPHHRVTPNVLSAVAALGAILVVIGVVLLELWPTLLGAALVYAGKLWFLDRMVWLYQDARNLSEDYQRWLY